MSKHTSGPWKVAPFQGFIYIEPVDGVGAVGEAYELADARLIAAAPELYEVSKAYEQWEADLILSNDAWAPDGEAVTPRITPELWERLLEIQKMRNAVLAKAEGRT